jgi:hypothetical protein
MKVTINNRIYLVSWHHEQKKFYIGNNIATGRTMCEIHAYEPVSKDKTLISSGISWTSVKDQFKKEVGRKISFTRALASWKRDERKLFWESYFNRIPKKI